MTHLKLIFNLFLEIISYTKAVTTVQQIQLRLICLWSFLIFPLCLIMNIRLTQICIYIPCNGCNIMCCV